MKKLSLVSFLVLVFAAGAVADISKTAIQEAIVPHSNGGATGFCSITYYNLCSGWLWIFSGWVPGDMAGVVFDLPGDCGKLPEEECSNTHFWWYWRYTFPARGYSLSYDLYEVDAQMCLTTSVGSIAYQDPVERWNYYDGLGTVSSDNVALVAKWNGGTLPYMLTEHNTYNTAAPVACPGFVPDVGRSYIWGNVNSVYCPPYHIAHDNYVDVLMDAGFDCEEVIGTEEASWGGIKSLFR